MGTRKSSLWAYPLDVVQGAAAEGWPRTPWTPHVTSVQRRARGGQGKMAYSFHRLLALIPAEGL